MNQQELEEKQIEELKKLKIIRLESNELASPSQNNVFFPLDRKGDYGFEAELRVIKRTLLEIKEKETKEKIVKFLKKLGVCDAQPYDIIENHILPIYESDDENNNWQSKDDKTLLGYIRYIKENLQDYEKESDKQLNPNKSYWGQKDDPLKRLKNSVYIRINKTVNGVNYDHPVNIYLPKTYGNDNDLELLFEGIENISFVHREYIDDIIKKYRQAKRKSKKGKADIEKNREAEVKEWRDFFVKLGVNDGLKVIKTSDTYLTWKETSKLRNGSSYTAEEVTDYSLIPLEEILEEHVKDTREKKEKKSKLLLALLERQWTKLSKYTKLKYEWRYYSWYSAYADSSWLHLLKTTPWLPTTKGTFAKPFEVFLDKPEIRKLLGDSVPYLTVNIKNEEFIKALGINTEASIEGVINNLKSLKEHKCQDKSIFTKLYDFLNKKYEGNEDTIKNVFSENPIIYLPHTTKSYFTSREVLWKDISDVFGENRGYLEKHYPGLKSFFVEKLGVNEKPTPKDYANVLTDLSQKEEITEKDEKIILKIYSELNNHLNPENNEHLISEEDWWKDFVSKPIFWTDKNEFWKNDDNVFVNDNPELYKSFKDSPQIAFLKLPRNYHPKIQHFIREVGVSYLSKVVETRLATGEGAKIEQNLTEQIRKFAPYILRYIYQLENDIYERLKKDGTFTQLKNLGVYSVDTLQVEYILDSCQPVITHRNSIFYNGNLYVQKDYLEDTDSLAVEFSKLFGEVRGLEDFLISLFEKKSEDKIENLLRVKGIQELPEDEKEWFGVVELEREVIEGKEDVETIVEKKPPTPHIPEVPPTSTLPETPEGPESVIEQEQIEKKEWRPEYTPTEVETHVEELQVLKKAEPEIKESEKPHSKPQPSPEPQKEKEIERDTLSQKDKMKIGRWGEEYALKYLKDTLSNKYTTGKVEETSFGFTIYVDDKLIVEVHWLNTIEDRGEGYDIKVVEDNIEEYIEVKSTKTDTKDWFEVSDKQWKLMEQKKDNFHIYRVYNAGTKEAKLIDIPNPYKKWQEGDLNAYPIRIQI